MSGPSPSKKPKYTERPVSPVRTHSNLKIKLKINESQVGSSSSTQSIPTANTAGPSSQAHGPIKRAVPEVVIPVRKRSASPVKPIVDDLDSEEDDLDWGDDGMVDQDGDYAMSDPAFVSPSPTRKIEPKGSGRTGERDQRCTSLLSYCLGTTPDEPQRILKSYKPTSKTFSKSLTRFQQNPRKMTYRPRSTIQQSRKVGCIPSYRFELLARSSITQPGSRANEGPKGSNGISMPCPGS
jgi:hypothetical protein